MGTFNRGEIVIMPFPFSNLYTTKRRPALVVANLPGDDMITCVITSQKSGPDEFCIPLTHVDFLRGGLKIDSWIKPNRLFTADDNIVIKSAGEINSDKLDEVINRIIEIIS